MKLVGIFLLCRDSKFVGFPTVEIFKRRIRKHETRLELSAYAYQVMLLSLDVSNGSLTRTTCEGEFVSVNVEGPRRWRVVDLLIMHVSLCY